MADDCDMSNGGDPLGVLSGTNEFELSNRRGLSLVRVQAVVSVMECC